MEVFPTTYALEVFANDSGGITIKQDSGYGEEPDLIVILPSHVGAVIRALRQAKREAMEE